MTGRRHIETVSATDDVIRAIDQAQYDTQEGPCLDVLYAKEVVRMNDMDAEQRWPQFTARARDHGVRSMLGFRLFMRDHDGGALNIFSEDRFAGVASDVVTRVAS